MADSEQVKRLKQGTLAWNAWMMNNPGVQPILSGADLSKIVLFGANLSEANLSKANLNWATLATADLGSANLSGATLFGAMLVQANLHATLQPHLIYSTIIWPHLGLFSVAQRTPSNPNASHNSVLLLSSPALPFFALLLSYKSFWSSEPLRQYPQS